MYQPEKETTEVSIKGSTTLGEIKELVPDFEAFLQEFGISEDEPLTAMLKDLKSNMVLKFRRFGNMWIVSSKAPLNQRAI